MEMLKLIYRKCTNWKAICTSCSCSQIFYYYNER